MTKADKPVRRETYARVRDCGQSRPLIVELHPTFAIFRQKGRRTKLTVEYGAIYDLAAKLAARERKREKDEKRKGNRFHA